MPDKTDEVLAKARLDEGALLDAEWSGSKARKLKVWARLSGPGWLQSAITLGGGSLASALYLGVLTGYGMLWLQPVAMILGVVMLAAIAHVTLSTGERPFAAIREHVNPVLAWGWIFAVLLANLVWSLPQFALGTAAIQQNLVPALEGTFGKVVSCAFILGAATTVIWYYDKGSRGLRVFEIVLKCMVGAVVLSFFGVVVTLAVSEQGVAWGEVLGGFVPDPSLLFEPAAGFDAVLALSGSAGFWRDVIVLEQRDVMIAAAATAVGINMTFLLPYSMLRKGWNQRFRGLAIFDLGTGLLIPFVLATSCVVIASASQFHTRYDEQLVHDVDRAAENPAYMTRLDSYLERKHGKDWLREQNEAEGLSSGKRVAIEDMSEADRRIAAMLLKRDAFGLAGALEPMTGQVVSQYVFGFGVLAMAVSTVIILMLISGFTFCEIFDRPPTGTFHRVGCLAAGIGVLGPFVWTGNARFWLAVPTSVFGMVLLPIAYWTFFLMMNNRHLMKEHLPTGRARWVWNTLMLLAAGTVTPAALYSIWTKAGWYGMSGLGVFLALAIGAHLRRR